MSNRGCPIHRTLGERLRAWGVPSDLAGFTDAFGRFREEYNAVRPHAALQYQTPAARFQPSPRAYTALPRAWEYPSGSDVHHVDESGSVAYAGHRWFVSQALTGEPVACTRHHRRVLVTFRNMYVREWHLRSGRSVPLWRRRKAAG